jgi:small basic protein (TIGR04137 family)
MSVHRSLKSRDRLKRQRSVLSRTERLEALAAEEKWEEGDSVFGLPKVRVFKTKRKVKAKKEKEGEGAEAAAEAAGAPPAEGEAAPEEKSEESPA